MLKICFIAYISAKLEKISLKLKRCIVKCDNKKFQSYAEIGIELQFSVLIFYPGWLAQYHMPDNNIE